jgi:spermidine/putrescine transport system permease protein
MLNEYVNPVLHRLKWAYLLALVLLLMLPVLYTIYISFNEHGFGAASYDFTLRWYGKLFQNEEIRVALGWSLLLCVTVIAITVPMGLVAAKFYKRTRYKVPFVMLMLAPLFVPADILAAALLVYFKNLNRFLSGSFGLAWFDLSLTTAVIGQVLWCLPYVFVVVLVTMSRYRIEQAEAARTCGATAWQAFWQVEFPQIRAGILAASAFAFILSFNEYTRTNFLKGGFETFPTYLVSYMLNVGMAPEVYAMAGLVSVLSILVIGSVLVFSLRGS